MKGFIVSDIDGTIYSKSKLPTERTATAFKRCRDLGYTVILATGGPKAQALKVLPSLNFEVDYLVCSNGNEAWKVDGSTQKLNRYMKTIKQHFQPGLHCVEFLRLTCKRKLPTVYAL